MAINIGDTVRFLREKGGGKVTGFRKGGLIMVEDKDGFEIPMHESDLVVIPDSSQTTPQSTTDSRERASHTPQASLFPHPSLNRLEERIQQLEATVQKLSHKIEEIQALLTNLS